MQVAFSRFDKRDGHRSVRIRIGHRASIDRIARQQAEQWRAIAIATIGPIDWPYPVANLLT